MFNQGERLTQHETIFKMTERFYQNVASDQAATSLITGCDFLFTTSSTSFSQVLMSKVISVTRDKQSQSTVSV